ncbi:MAG: RNA-binding S4 domain-containing protein [Pseudomonadota bacterium]
MSEEGLRLDKWLWYARFFKSRSLATQVCNGGKVRVAGQAVSKAHMTVRPDMILTFPQGQHIRVIKVLALTSRRGPASEAQQLYEDLKPPERASRLPKGTPPPVAKRESGSGRPTKKDRRATDRWRGESK